MAEACDCSSTLLENICKRALNKVRVRLAERGLTRKEALMLLEVLGSDSSYHPQAAEPEEDSVPL